VTAPAVTVRDRSAIRLLAVLLAGAAMSVALGVYGDRHTPSGEAPYSLFFTQTIQLKVWFATAAAILAVVTNGRSGMPAFGGELSDAEIRQVAEYTRKGLGSQYG
jgi:hypothetical protein